MITALQASRTKLLSRMIAMHFATSPRNTSTTSSEHSDFHKKFKGFPYRFDNRTELVVKPEGQPEEELKMMTKFLSLPGSADGSVDNKDGFKLLEGFKMAYVALLESIAANNGQMIGKMCEPLLHREFNQGF